MNNLRTGRGRSNLKVDFDCWKIHEFLCELNFVRKRRENSFVYAEMRELP